MDTPRLVVLVLILIFLFVAPDAHQPTPGQRRELDHLVAEERHALDVLNSSRYGDFNIGNKHWLNVTGLREEDGYLWEVLPQVQHRAKELLEAALGQDGVRQLDPPDDAPGSGGDASAGERSPPQLTQTGVQLPLYSNMTGYLRGEWVRAKVGQDVPAPIINLTALLPESQFAAYEYTRNITGSGGKVQLRLKEREEHGTTNQEPAVRSIGAKLMIKDSTSSGDGWEMKLYGVHFPNLGEAVLTTTSEKFAGLFALPHFALSEHTYLQSQHFLNRTLNADIKSQESSLYTGPSYPWSSSPDSSSDLLLPTPHCEYIIYLQQQAVSLTGDRTAGLLHQIEDELRFPKGAPIPPAPPLVMSMLIFSPDCGFVLESKGPPDFSPQEGLHLSGLKLEVYLRQAKRYILLAALILGLEVISLMRQMREASTPSTRSRISFYTIAMMAMGDGFSCIAFLTVGLFIDSAFLVLVTTSFLAFFCVSFLGMKFLMDIWTVQAPERTDRERQQQAAATATATATATTATNRSRTTPGTIITPAGADTLPLPVTARQATNSGATPIVLPPDQDSPTDNIPDPMPTPTPAPTTAATTTTPTPSPARTFGALYARFYFLLLSILFLSLHATTWPTSLRSAYTNILSFLYLSIWLPQIYRNIQRNCRKALRYEFVISQSLLRLAPFLYFYTAKSNVLFVETDGVAACVLAGWVWCQVWVLVSQDLLGARWFIRKGWAPEAYDYHPMLSEGDEEKGGIMPVGFTQATSPTSPTDPSASSTTFPSTAGPAAGAAAAATATTTTDPTAASPAADKASSSIPTTPAATRSRSMTTRVFDCAICMQNIEVSVETRSSSSSSSSSHHHAVTTVDPAAAASSLLARRAYMVTPCRHIFHTPCLEGWMRFRLQCPICREGLPPL
ncbi:MAG: hypothetical protein M1819_000388 [Sarea resinae]|nr:MAG: hypothetical protein M1819_000388 [Sarea resinae]